MGGGDPKWGMVAPNGELWAHISSSVPMGGDGDPKCHQMGECWLQMGTWWPQESRDWDTVTPNEDMVAPSVSRLGYGDPKRGAVAPHLPQMSPWGGMGAPGVSRWGHGDPKWGHGGPK